MAHWNGTPRTWVAGDYIRNWQLNTEIRDRLRSLRYLNECSARLYPTSNQSLKNGEREVLNITAANWNIGGMWTSGSKVVVPLAGVYLLFGKTEFAANATGSRRVGLRFDEADEFWCSTVDSIDTAGKSTILSFVREFELAAETTIEFTAWQDSGGEILAVVSRVGVRFLGVTA